MSSKPTRWTTTCASLSGTCWCAWFDEADVHIYPQDYDPDYDSAFWCDAVLAIGRDSIKHPVDELPVNRVQCRNWLKGFFSEFEWFEVFDLIEFVVGNVPVPGRSPEGLREAVNEILEREASGYRFIAERLAPISSEVELAAIDGAVAAADDQGLHVVSGHIRTLVAKLREPPDADYRNAIKELSPRWSPRRSWSLGSKAAA